MASLTIRNIDEQTKRALRLRGALRGTSMEDEARAILRAIAKTGVSLEDLASLNVGESKSAWEAVKRLRDAYGTFEISVPERSGVAGERIVFK